MTGIRNQQLFAVALAQSEGACVRDADSPTVNGIMQKAHENEFARGWLEAERGHYQSDKPAPGAYYAGHDAATEAGVSGSAKPPPSPAEVAAAREIVAAADAVLAAEEGEGS